MERELFGKYEGWLTVLFFAIKHEIERHGGIAYLYLGIESAVLVGSHLELKRNWLVLPYEKRYCIILNLVRVGGFKDKYLISF